MPAKAFADGADHECGATYMERLSIAFLFGVIMPAALVRGGMLLLVLVRSATGAMSLGGMGRICGWR